MIIFLESDGKETGTLPIIRDYSLLILYLFQLKDQEMTWFTQRTTQLNISHCSSISSCKLPPFQSKSWTGASEYSFFLIKIINQNAVN